MAGAGQPENPVLPRCQYRPTSDPLTVAAIEKRNMINAALRGPFLRAMAHIERGGAASSASRLRDPTPSGQGRLLQRCNRSSRHLTPEGCPLQSVSCGMAHLPRTEPGRS
jgi:hypothetical protein